MFTYINPDVRQTLIRDGKLLKLDLDGAVVDPGQPIDGGARSIHLLGPIPLPVKKGTNRSEANWYAAVRSSELSDVENLASQLLAQDGQHLFAHLASSMAVNSVLEIGPAAKSSSPLVRVHSSCLTGDIFGSRRCECGPQLESAIDRIREDPEGGYIVYMAGHEGRGIGLWAKAATYLLQDSGENTYQANRSLGLPDDSRDFSDAATLLKYFGKNRHLRLLTNNPKKIDDLVKFGVRNIKRVKHISGVDACNVGYMRAKQAWGHRIDEKDLNSRD